MLQLARWPAVRARYCCGCCCGFSFGFGGAQIVITIGIFLAQQQANKPDATLPPLQLL